MGAQETPNPELIVAPGTEDPHQLQTTAPPERLEYDLLRQQDRYKSIVTV